MDNAERREYFRATTRGMGFFPNLLLFMLILLYFPISILKHIYKYIRDTYYTFAPTCDE